MNEQTQQPDTGNGAQNAPNKPKNLPAIVAGHKPVAIVPQTFEDAYRIAKAVCQAGMAPKGVDTAEKVTIAIMHGLEVGFPPMMALQSIAVINGRPTIWGDGALALVRSSGICEYVKEWEEDEIAYCEVRRKGEKEAVTRSFSQEDARAAGLAGKDGPWRTYPRRMRQMRARAWAIRDTFADVLKGLSIREEVEDFVEVNAAPAIPAEISGAKAPPQKVIEHKPAATMEKVETKETVPAEVMPPAIALTEPAKPKRVRNRAKKAAEPKAETENPAPPAQQAEGTPIVVDQGKAVAAIKERLDAIADKDRLQDVWLAELEALYQQLDQDHTAQVDAHFRETETRLGID